MAPKKSPNTMTVFPSSPAGNRSDVLGRAFGQQRPPSYDDRSGGSPGLLQLEGSANVAEADGFDPPRLDQVLFLCNQVIPLEVVLGHVREPLKGQQLEPRVQCLAHGAGGVHVLMLVDPGTRKVFGEQRLILVRRLDHVRAIPARGLFIHLIPCELVEDQQTTGAEQPADLVESGLEILDVMQRSARYHRVEVCRLRKGFECHLAEDGSFWSVG